MKTKQEYFKMILDKNISDDEVMETLENFPPDGFSFEDNNEIIELLRQERPDLYYSLHDEMVGSLELDAFESLLCDIMKDFANKGYHYDFSYAAFINSIGKRVVGEVETVRLSENFEIEGQIVAILTNVVREDDSKNVSVITVYSKEYGNYFLIEDTEILAFGFSLDEEKLLSTIKEKHKDTYPDYDYSKAKFTERIGQISIGEVHEFRVQEGVVVPCSILSILTNIKSKNGVDVTFMVVSTDELGVCFATTDSFSFSYGASIGKN